MHVYRLLNQSVPEQQWALFNIGSQCPINDSNDGHVGKDPIRSAHMNIQQKFLSIVAYEGFVFNIKKEYIETTFSIGSSCRKQMLMVWRDIQWHPLTLPTRKQCNKEMVYNRIIAYIYVIWIHDIYLIIITFHIAILHYDIFWIWGRINCTVMLSVILLL